MIAVIIFILALCAAAVLLPLLYDRLYPCPDSYSDMADRWYYARANDWTLPIWERHRARVMRRRMYPRHLRYFADLPRFRPMDGILEGWKP